MVRRPRGKAETEQFYAVALLITGALVAVVVGVAPLLCNNPHTARETIVTILIGVAAIAFAVLVGVRMRPGFERLSLLDLLLLTSSEFDLETTHPSQGQPAPMLRAIGATREPPLRQRAEAELQLTGVDLREVTLPEVDLSETDLSQAKLTGANLSKASMQNSDLTEADLRQIDLQGANLAQSSLIGAALDESSLQGADLRGANLEGASLEKSTLQRASLVDGSLARAALDEASLEWADLRGVDLSGASLQNASLTGAVFDDATISPSPTTDLRELGAVHVDELG